MILVPIHEASALIEACIKAKIVPFIKGSPGIGKSQIVYAIAKKYGLKVIDIRLAQCDPVDLMGFATIDKTTGKGYYAPMATFPIKGDKVPDGYNGWLLFMDELTSAPRALQAASYKIILDRMVGMEHLHKNVAIVAAGNLDSDGAIVEEMSTALKSRMAHINVEPHNKKWADWASAEGFDARITSYINSGGALTNFKPDSPEDTYGCPRTWEFTNRLLLVAPPKLENVALYAGVLGEGLAREFIAYCDLAVHMPQLSEILANPKLVQVPDEPSVLWMLCGVLSKALTPKNADTLMEFINRIPVEFQVVCLRQAKLKDTPEMIKQKSIIDWVTRNGAELWG